MIYGLLFVFAIWMLFYGLNIVIRAVMVRNYLAQHDALAMLTLRRRSKEKIEWLNLIFLAFFTSAGVAGITQSKPITLGIMIAAGTLLVLWPLYVRSNTRTTELLYFDSKGMTIFPARTAMLYQGAFRIRIDWKDTFGYNIYKGNILFSLLPSGYVEQHYGEERLRFKQILDGLGIRKLVAYDVVAQAERDDWHEELRALEQHVETTLRDVVLGHAQEFAMLGYQLDVDCMEHEMDTEEDGDGSGNGNNFSIVRVKLLQGEVLTQELEWLVWERYNDVIELISLPDDRLYETFDERLQAVLHQKMRDAGIEPRETLLQ